MNRPLKAIRTHLNALEFSMDQSLKLMLKQKKQVQEAGRLLSNYQGIGYTPVGRQEEEPMLLEPEAAPPDENAHLRTENTFLAEENSRLREEVQMLRRQVRAKGPAVYHLNPGDHGFSGPFRRLPGEGISA